MNAWKGGHRPMLRELARLIRSEIKASRTLISEVYRVAVDCQRQADRRP